MKLLPVFEVVEIHGVEDAAVVVPSDRAENTTTGVVIVIVASNRGIVFGDLRIVEAAIGGAPSFAGDVGRLFSRDVVEESLTVDAEGIEGHLVETGTRCGILGVEVTNRGERSFLPEAREMLHTERTCGA